MGLEQRVAVSWRRCGFCRAAVFFMAVMAVALFGGCGRSGHGAETDSEKAADVEILNVALARELTAIEAYDLALPRLQGHMLAVGREFRGQAQAHVDALTKAIRGLGGETEAEAGEVEAPAPRTQGAALVLLYEEENESLTEALDAVPHLVFSAPRTLAASLAANHAQHLAILRQGLGAELVDAVPEPFESGDEPPPPTPPRNRG